MDLISLGVGIAVGAAFTPVWVFVWGKVSAFIVKKDPAAAPVIQKVEAVVDDVNKTVTPAS